MRTLEEMRNKAIETLESNDELFVDMVNELDSWNGYADGFRAFPMYELNDIFCDIKLTDFLNMIDEENFDLHDDYFIDTIWGIRSTDDIIGHYKDNVWTDELLDNIIDNVNNIWFNDKEFEALIDDLANYEALVEEEANN